MTITLPPPLERDIDANQSLRFYPPAPLQPNRSANASLLLPASLDEAEEGPAWVAGCQGAVFFVMPVVLGTGLLLGVVSCVALARRLRHASEAYLLALVLNSLLLLVCACVIKMQEYVESSATYERLYGYVRALHDWLWYTSLWVLIVLTLERAMASRQGRSACSRAQAALVSGLISCVCLLSALPQFWEYEVTETFDYVSNTTQVMSVLSSVADSPEFSILYFWYTVVLTVVLPYPLLALTAVLLTRGLRRQDLSRKHVPTGDVLNRRLNQDVHAARLCLWLIGLYIVLTGPATLLSVIHGVSPYWTWPQDHLYTGLYPVLELTFYFYYATLFFLLCSHSDHFRRNLLQCCGRKGPPPALSPEHTMRKPRKAR